MTEPKFNPELAWDIQEWDGDISREDVKALTYYLTEKGYSKDKTGGFGSLLSQLEDVGVKVVDEIGPLIDGLRSRK